MAGISNMLESLDDLESCLILLLELVKGGGFSFGKIGQVVSLINRAVDLAADLGKCLPEIKDLDSQEAGQLSSRCYEMVLKIIQKVKA